MMEDKPRHNGLRESNHQHNMCKTDCPNLQIIQELQNELAYYKNRCAVYEDRSQFANRSSIRMSIQRVHTNVSDQTNNDWQFDVNKQNKSKLLEFSQLIQQKLHKLSTKNKGIGAKERSVISEGKSDSKIDLSREDEASSSNKKPKCVEEQVMEPMEVFQSRLLVKEAIEQAPLQFPYPVKHQRLISDLCIFGLNLQSIENSVRTGDTQLRPQLIYSLYNLFDSERFDFTAEYLFPQGVKVHKVKKNKQLNEINPIMFQTNKKQSSFIYAFRSDEMDLGHLTTEQLQLLNQVNPSKRLFCICIKINEYTMAKEVVVQQKKADEPQDALDVQSPIRDNKKAESGKVMYTTKRIMCIFTLYPFFDFFESVLISLSSEFKIERLKIFKNDIKTLLTIDSQFIESLLDQSYNKIIDSFNKIKIIHNYNYEFIFGNDSLKLNTEKSQLANTNMSGWIVSILKLFNKDTFYEVLSAILFEEQVVFICQNLHVLTYTIYLFTELLFRPFMYPHPCLYIMPETTFLEAVSPIVLGINEKPKWLEEYYKPEQLEKETKMFVLLGEEAVIIESKREKRPRSEALRKTVKQFYKNYEKGISFFKKKKDDDGATEVRQALKFIHQVNKYFEEEFRKQIPNINCNEQIEKKRKELMRSEKDDDRQFYSSYINDIVQKEMLKAKKDKDGFNTKFLNGHVFQDLMFNQVGFN